MYNLKRQTTGAQIHQNTLSVGKQVRAAWWAALAAAESVRDRCRCQLQLLRGFIPNITVVCKAAESILQLTSFVENEKIVPEKEAED